MPATARTVWRRGQADFLAATGRASRRVTCSPAPPWTQSRSRSHDLRTGASEGQGGSTGATEPSAAAGKCRLCAGRPEWCLALAAGRAEVSRRETAAWPSLVAASARPALRAVSCLARSHRMPRAERRLAVNRLLRNLRASAGRASWGQKRRPCRSRAIHRWIKHD